MSSGFNKLSGPGIAFDTVVTEEGIGVIFEFINGKTLGTYMSEHWDRFDELLDKYVDLLKQFHATKADTSKFRSSKEEVDLSRKFQRMIANFCCTGDPSAEDVKWPVYTAEERSTMMIGQNMRVEKNPEGARVDAALKMVDLHEDFRYLKNFSETLPIVWERYPDVCEAFVMNALSDE